MKNHVPGISETLQLHTVETMNLKDNQSGAGLAETRRGRYVPLPI